MDNQLLIDSVVDNILRAEGGYVDDPHDLGGPTNMGITLKTLEDWRKAPVTKEDLMHLTTEEARLIYTQLYVLPFQAYIGSEWLFRLAVDSAVQHGIVRVQSWLAAISSSTQDPEVLRRVLFKTRLRFYGEIITSRPANSTFAKGWMARVSEFAR
jgi:lysozyme family protein